MGGAAPALLAERGGGARERRDRRRLGHAADPRRRPAGPAEVVLPGEEVAAAGGEVEQAVDRAAQLSDRAGAALLEARAREPVDPAPARQRLELHPAARVVLEHRRAEARALAGGRHRRARPEVGVAAEDEERGLEPARGEQMLGGERVDRAEDRGELGRPQALEARDGATGGFVVAHVAGVGGGADALGQERMAERAGDRGRLAGAADRGAQARLGGGPGAPRRGLELPGPLGLEDLRLRRRPRARLADGAAAAQLRPRAAASRSIAGPWDRIVDPAGALDEIGPDSDRSLSCGDDARVHEVIVGTGSMR